MHMIFPASNPELGKSKESVGSCSRVLHLSFSSRGRMGVPGWKIVNVRACEEFEDNDGAIYWVNISKSF